MASASETWARWPLESRRSFGFPRQLEMVEDPLEQPVVPTAVKGAREADRFADRHPVVERMPFGEIGDPGPRFGSQVLASLRPARGPCRCRDGPSR